jgi:type I restriction enzyme S subunit
MSDRVALQPDVSYVTAGILSYGKGLFQRPAVLGSETSYQSYFRLGAGQFVYSKLFAWEGALAVVTPEFDGMFVSPEFPIFAIDDDQALVEYVRLLCGWPPLWERVRAGQTGMGGRRKRVHPDRLLEVIVPLPPVPVQRRLTDLVSAIDAVIAEYDSAAAAAYSAIEAIRRTVLESAEDRVPLVDLCSIEARLVDPTTDEHRELPHVGVDRIEARTGRLLSVTSAEADGVTSGKYRFSENEIVYAKIRPELRKVAFPGFDGLSSADAYPLRPRPGVPPEFLQEVLLTDVFSDQAIARSGRTKMPKINRQELFSIDVPDLPGSDRLRFAANVQAIRETWQLMIQAGSTARVVRDGVVESLLSGEHEIPDSYDTLLTEIAPA